MSALLDLFNDAEASGLLRDAVAARHWRVYDPPDWPDWLDLEGHTMGGVPVKVFVAFTPESSSKHAVFICLMAAGE